jgi:hypothetical protein
MRLVASLCAIFAVTLYAVACGGSDDKGGGLLSGDNKSAQPTAAVAAATTGAPAPTQRPATSPTAQANNAAALNPCTLFTKEDAAAALGKPVKDGELRKGGEPLNQQLCFYATVESTGESVQLSLIQTSLLTQALRNNGQTAKVQYEQQKALAGAGTVTDLPGVGQGAFIRGTNVYGYKGDTEFSVLLLGNGKPGDASHTNALKAAATKVVGKLP